MGYYCDIEPYLVVKRGMEEAFSLAIEREKNIGGQMSETFLEYISCEKDRSIAFDECWGKWSSQEEFARFIAAYVEEGKLLFIGEDSERWGYYFNGKGNVQFISFVETISDEYLL